MLVEVGPTIPVEIGYDPGYDEFVDAKPALSPDLYPALVDTGASGNSVDDELAISLRLPIIYYEWEVSGSAGTHTVNLYLAQIHIPELTRTISGQLSAFICPPAASCTGPSLGGRFSVISRCSMMAAPGRLR